MFHLHGLPMVWAHGVASTDWNLGTKAAGTMRAFVPAVTIMGTDRSACSFMKALEMEINHLAPAPGQARKVAQE